MSYLGRNEHKALSLPNFLVLHNAVELRVRLLQMLVKILSPLSDSIRASLSTRCCIFIIQSIARKQADMESNLFGLGGYASGKGGPSERSCTSRSAANDGAEASQSC